LKIVSIAILVIMIIGIIRRDDEGKRTSILLMNESARQTGQSDVFLILLLFEREAHSKAYDKYHEHHGSDCKDRIARYAEPAQCVHEIRL
jgi:hypothetical protein